MNLSVLSGLYDKLFDHIGNRSKTWIYGLRLDVDKGHVSVKLMPSRRATDIELAIVACSPDIPPIGDDFITIPSKSELDKMFNYYTSHRGDAFPTDLINRTITMSSISCFDVVKNDRVDQILFLTEVSIDSCLRRNKEVSLKSYSISETDSGRWVTIQWTDSRVEVPDRSIRLHTSHASVGIDHLMAKAISIFEVAVSRPEVTFSDHCVDDPIWENENGQSQQSQD